MTPNPSGQRSISYKVIKNTVYNIFGRFWGILVSIFLTPYIISSIGLERFGVWAIVGVVTGYFGLLDLGIGTSFVKYIAEFYAKKEFDKINNIINTGFTLYCALAIVTTMLIFLLKNPILAFLNMPAYLRYEAGVVLVIGITLFGASNAMSPFAAVQGGLQRMDISNNIAAAMSTVNIAGTIFFLSHGYGLIGLMINNVIIFIGMAAVNIIIAYKLLPELRFRIFSFDQSIFKKLFRFGYHMQIAKVAGIIAGQTDKILITCFLSIGFVTFYQLGSSIVYYAASLAAILTSALMPAFSEIEARSERPRLVEAYLRSMKYISFFIVPIFIYLIISAQQVIFMWMGYGYEQSVFVIQILAAAFLMNTIGQVPGSVCLAIDKPQLMAVGAMVIIVTNIILSALFIRIFGFLGVAWGTLIAVNTGTIFFLVRLHAEMKISIWKMVKVIMPYFIGCAVAWLVLFIAGALTDKSSFVLNAGRVETMVLFFVKGALFLLSYLTCIYYLKPFNADEMEIIKRKVPYVGPTIVRMITRS